MRRYAAVGKIVKASRPTFLFFWVLALQDRHVRHVRQKLRFYLHDPRQRGPFETRSLRSSNPAHITNVIKVYIGGNYGQANKTRKRQTDRACRI